MVADEIGEDNGVLIFDDSSFPKKGNDFACVSRQCLGVLARWTTVRWGAFPPMPPPHGYVLADRRLFLPEKWFGPDYAERRK